MVDVTACVMTYSLPTVEIHQRSESIRQSCVLMHRLVECTGERVLSVPGVLIKQRRFRTVI